MMNVVIILCLRVCDTMLCCEHVILCMCVYVQNIADPSLVEDPAKDKQFAEPAVDTMRVQKDEVRLLQLAYVTFHNVLT